MKSEILTVQGISSHIIRIGKGDQTLILLHGWNSDRAWRPLESFKKIAKGIAQKNKLEVIVVDLPGFGDSEPPPEEGWHTWDYAQWLAALLQELKIKKCSFYGHSFGCRVIIRYLLNQAPKSSLPQGTKNMARVTVDKVILTGAAGIKWPLTFREKISIFLSQKLTFAKSFVPQVIQKYIITKVLGARDWGAAPQELKSTLSKVLAEKDFRQELKKIRTQILLVWGKGDSVTPLKSGEVYRQQLPNATLEILEEAKHGMHKTHPKEVVQLVTDFLSDR